MNLRLDDGGHGPPLLPLQKPIDNVAAHSRGTVRQPEESKRNKKHKKIRRVDRMVHDRKLCGSVQSVRDNDEIVHKDSPLIQSRST